MAVYERSYQALTPFNFYRETVRLTEQHIYGSDRIGLRKCNVLVYQVVFTASIDSNTHRFTGKGIPVVSEEDGTPGNDGRGPVASPAVHVIVGSGNHLAEQYQRTLGDKRYELKNHLGNVLTVITDRKIAVDNVSYVSGNGTYISAPSNNQLYLHVTTGTFIQLSSPDLKVDYYTAEIVKSTEYSCYGVELSGWGYVNIDSYRYGFNGKELDQDGMGGGGSTYDYGFRIYNPALGKFLSVDPLIQSYPWYTPYQFAGNTPIGAIDLDGLEPLLVGKSNVFFLRMAPVLPALAPPPVVVPVNAPTAAPPFSNSSNSSFNSGQEKVNYYIMYWNLPKYSWVRRASNGTIIQTGSDFDNDGFPELVSNNEAYYDLGYDVIDANTWTAPLPFASKGDPENMGDQELRDAFEDAKESIVDNNYFERLSQEYQNRFYTKWLYSKPGASKELAYDDCVALAKIIQNEIGGEFIYISPSGPRQYISSVKLTNGEELKEHWAFHVAVNVNGMVYDGVTGSSGMPYEDYQKLFVGAQFTIISKEKIDDVK
jgi:RHS repeat-associated protein